MTLLGQVVRHLAEATHILDFVSGQVDLNLGEASSSMTQAAHEANEAFEAASLLMNGAELDTSWSNYASRPKAVFARHRAAVAAGAQRLHPAPAPMIVQSEPSPVSHGELPPKPPNAARPKCGHPTKTTGKLCGNRVVVLEDGILATGCATHLPDAERPSYEQQKAQTDAWMDAAVHHQQSNKARMMADATALWLRRQARELGIDWDDFCDTIDVAANAITETSHDAADSGVADIDRWEACGSCAPHVADIVALASVGMQFLHTWATRQRPPRWADRSWPAGAWLLEVPPKGHAHRDELGLHLAASVLAEIATPTGDIANAVDAREREITDAMLGQFAHADTLRAPSEADEAPVPNVAPPRPGARPVNGKRSKKKRKQR
ncbi:hypothetical protein CFN78_23735 [Amycolatopsis antarctica]|uniref:Uncharacterized protein n=1 Tax=Amycolatopsis antarctica TaxID=1854586 RepID=A0A263CXM5_9PSEU|nr:hypothetical protein CFN78_23735 [Amycolatopsis antarctica]